MVRRSSLAIAAAKQFALFIFFESALQSHRRGADCISMSAMKRLSKHAGFEEIFETVSGGKEGPIQLSGLNDAQLNEP